MRERIAESVHLVHYFGKLDHYLYLLTQADSLVAAVDAVRLEDDLMERDHLRNDHTNFHLFAHVDAQGHHNELRHLVERQSRQVRVERLNLVVRDAIVVDNAA